MSQLQITFHKRLPLGSQTDLEVELQTIASKYGFAPKVYEIFHTNTETIICMERINAPCLADVYGENPQEIPHKLWKQIETIVTTLYEEEGIEYVDLTPYNFIELPNEKLYIIDFGDAYYTDKNMPKHPNNWFLREFLDGEMTWNPDFK